MPPRPEAVLPTPGEGRRLDILTLTYHEVTEDPRVFRQARALAARGHRVTVLCHLPPGRPRTEILQGVWIVRFDCFAPRRADPRDLDGFPFLGASRALIEPRYQAYARAIAKRDDLLGALEAARREARVPAIGQAACEQAHEGYGEAGPTADALDATVVLMRRRIEEMREIYRSVGERLRAEGLSAEKRQDLTGRHDVLRARIDAWVASREAVKQRRDEARAVADRATGPGDAPPTPATTRLRRKIEEQAGVVKRRFRDLYQAQSIVFATNLLAEDLPMMPDVVHAHDVYTLPAALRVGALHGARVLYDAHEYEPGRATKMPPEGPGLVDAIERDCLAHVDRMTTVGPGIAGLYRERFGAMPDLILNAPEMDMAAFAEAGAGPRAGRLRAMTGLAGDVPLIVFTGGTQREARGMDKLCLALRLLPRHHFVALGPRNARNDAWLMEAAKAAGVSGRVRLLPPVPANEVVATIGDADLAVCPIQDAGVSYRLAMPNKLFEAAFARLPIVVSDLPEMRRFVEEMGIGLAMDQTDPEAMARAIDAVTRDPGRYVLTPAKAREMAEAYGWAAQEARLVRIVAEMAESPPRIRWADRPSARA